jgi:hypothetical protein
MERANVGVPGEEGVGMEEAVVEFGQPRVTSPARPEASGRAPDTTQWIHYKPADS